MIFHHRGFYSPQLDNERTLSVWVPDGYAERWEERYPVIYMQDGQNVLDPSTSFSGVAWRTDEVIRRLAREGGCREAIIVAIDSNQDREEEYDFMERGEDYARFIIDTVKPCIDQDYRTESGRESSYLMGASLGATISFEILWRYPEVFSKAAGLSLPAFYNEYSIFDLFRQRGRPELPVTLYMDHGTRGQDHWYGKSARAFHQLLKELGMDDDHLVYRKFTGADHTEADWGERSDVALRVLLGC